MYELLQCSVLADNTIGFIMEFVAAIELAVFVLISEVISLEAQCQMMTSSARGRISIAIAMLRQLQDDLMYFCIDTLLPTLTLWFREHLRHCFDSGGRIRSHDRNVFALRMELPKLLR